MTDAPSTVQRALSQALAAQRHGDTRLSETLFRTVIEADPAHPEALNALGIIALGKSDNAEAAAFFARASAADPQAPPLWLNLAKAHRLLGDDDGEARALKAALEIDQRHFTANVRLAELHERRGQLKEAHQRWAGVLQMARAPGATAEMHGIIEHADRYVRERNASLALKLKAFTANNLDMSDAAAKRRYTTCLDVATGHRQIYTNSCAGLHYPFLPADEFFDRHLFPWMELIEESTGAIREEFEALLRDGSAPFEPYVQQDKGTPRNIWSELNHSNDWSALYLWKYGIAQQEVLAACPRTASALARIALAEIPGRGPTAFFSVLQPHGRIPAHTGVTNVRAIVHLPLIVPPACSFRVGGETRQWVEGRAFAFDDTIEHEAWNDSEELRAVLIFDVWNPHITLPEQEMLVKFFEIADAADLGPQDHG